MSGMWLQEEAVPDAPWAFECIGNQHPAHLKGGRISFHRNCSPNEIRREYSYMYGNDNDTL